jgi:hypothetical protein
MALHFRLRVNDETIGVFSAQRHERQVPADGVCTYDVIIAKKFPLDDVELIVKHNYYDGAWTLVRKAIETMEELDRMTEALGS